MFYTVNMIGLNAANEVVANIVVSAPIKQSVEAKAVQQFWHGGTAARVIADEIRKTPSVQSIKAVVLNCDGEEVL